MLDTFKVERLEIPTRVDDLHEIREKMTQIR